MPDRAHIRGLHLAALASFAVSQPLFDILQRYPTFLVSHRLERMDILSLAFLLGIGIPATFFGLGWLTRLVGRRLGSGVYSALVVLLLAATALPAVHRTGWNGILALGLTAIAAAAIGLAYFRSPGLQKYVTWLALAVVAFPVLFLGHGPIRTLAFGSGSTAISYADIEGETPVVLLIFDEFPLVSLLREDRQVDAVRYPHFAALAARSHWFRNASTVASYTEQAVPAILTGTFPEGDRLPHHGEYRQTLFTLLGGSYAMHVEEPITLLFPPELERLAAEQESRPKSTFVRDLVLIYLHILIPPDLTSPLPSVSEGWRDFGGSNPEEERNRERHSNELATLNKLRQESDRSRVDVALEFIDEISGEEPRTLHVLHTMLPHNRWRHTASGRHYCRKGLKNPGQIKDVWPEESRYSELAWQRHLMQAETADRLLGRLIQKLETVGLFDRALLIVTADHGASFWPGASLRSLEQATHPPDILDVPLLIKLPGQRTSEHTDRHVRTIDILPTITEVLGIGPPLGIDGVSVFDETHTAPVKRARDSDGGFAEFDVDADLKYRTLDRMIQFFGSGVDGSIHAVGDHRALLGQSIGQLEPLDGGSWILRVDPNYFRNTAKYGKFVPVFITGEIEGPVGPVSVAGSVNGVVEAVARAVPIDDGRSEFHLLLPEDRYGAGEVEIELFVLDERSGRFARGGLSPIRFNQKPLPANYPSE